jgi:cobalt-zinc-cadmium efflux system outer membrane protein
MSMKISPRERRGPQRLSPATRRSNFPAPRKFAAPPVFASSLALAALLALATAGCTLAPRGLDAEQASLAAVRAAVRAEFRTDADRTGLPAPGDGDDWPALLCRAFLANAEIRAAWLEWKAAVVEVRGASAWPNTSLAFGYARTFGDAAATSFDRNSFTLGTDSMQNLAFPGKTMAAGRDALSKARAAGERFRATRFAVRRRAFGAWLDLALAAETERLARQRAGLVAVAEDSADARLRGGQGQGRSLSARIDAARAEDGIAAAATDVAAARAELAAILAIEPPERLALPSRLPRPRRAPRNLAALENAVAGSPEVRELVHERDRSRAALDLAELQWIPDINPTAAFSGSMEQAVGLMVMLPTRFASIRSGIASARAMRRAASARLVQAGRDQRARLRTALAEAADAARGRRLLEERVLPAASAAVAASESAYVTGAADLADVVEARLLVVEVRTEIAAAAIERERTLADLEEILGADLETLVEIGASPAASAAATSRENLR